MTRILLAALALCVVLRPAEGYIDAFRPASLGEVCARADSVTVMKVDKFSKEKGVIIYRKVKDLKGAFPRDDFREVLSKAHLEGDRKHRLDWVAEGKTVLVFRYENRVAVCIGDHWSVGDQAPPKDKEEVYTMATRTEPFFLQSYCGDAKKLLPAVTDLLAGKEVVVPCMIGGRDKELRDRTGKLAQARTNLKQKGFDPKRDLVKEK